MANYRSGRINEEVKREISIIIRDEIKDLEWLEWYQ